MENLKRNFSLSKTKMRKRQVIDSQECASDMGQDESDNDDTVEKREILTEDGATLSKDLGRTQCDICGKSLSNKGALYKHMMVIHQKFKPFMCEICGQSFGQHGDLKRHRITHTGEKLFKCEVCGKLLSKNSCLKLHMRIHTGEKPFHCTVCKKSFSIHSDLKRHARIHSGERKYTCTLCARAFGRREHLSAHYVTHSKMAAAAFKCQLCGEVFKDKTVIRKHYLKHIGAASKSVNNNDFNETSKVKSLVHHSVKVNNNKDTTESVTDLNIGHMHPIRVIEPTSIDKTQSAINCTVMQSEHSFESNRDPMKIDHNKPNPGQAFHSDQGVKISNVTNEGKVVMPNQTSINEIPFVNNSNQNHVHTNNQIDVPLISQIIAEPFTPAPTINNADEPSIGQSEQEAYTSLIEAAKACLRTDVPTVATPFLPMVINIPPVNVQNTVNASEALAIGLGGSDQGTKIGAQSSQSILSNIPHIVPVVAQPKGIAPEATTVGQNNATRLTNGHLIVPIAAQTIVVTLPETTLKANSEGTFTHLTTRGTNEPPLDSHVGFDPKSTNIQPILQDILETITDQECNENSSLTTNTLVPNDELQATNQNNESVLQYTSITTETHQSLCDTLNNSLKMPQIEKELEITKENMSCENNRSETPESNAFDDNNSDVDETSKSAAYSLENEVDKEKTGNSRKEKINRDKSVGLRKGNMDRSTRKPGRTRDSVDKNVDQTSFNDRSSKKKSSQTKANHGQSNRIKETVDSKNYMCDICGLRFRYLAQCKKHKFAHTGEKPYKCVICNKSYALKGDLKLHIESHTNEKQHMCEICGNSYKWAKSLRIHMQTHADSRPHKCDRCSAAFYLKADLARHIKGHSGVRPYKCDICEKSFARKEHLKTHGFIHLDAKPNQCQFCDKSFAQKVSLQKHMSSCTGKVD